MNKQLCWITAIACALMSCARPAAMPQILVPRSAFDKVEMQPSDREYGLKFRVTVGSDSYLFVDDMRRQLVTAGFEKCEKSAISKWTLMPGRTEPNTLWLVEMFTNPQQDKFAVLRAEQRNNDSDAKADQTFYVLFQDVNRASKNAEVISEFCNASIPVGKSDSG